MLLSSQEDMNKTINTVQMCKLAAFTELRYWVKWDYLWYFGLLPGRVGGKTERLVSVWRFQSLFVCFPTCLCAPVTDEGIDLIWQVTVMRREAASLSLLRPWTQSARNVFVWLLGNCVKAADWSCPYKIDFFTYHIWVVLYFIII